MRNLFGKLFKLSVAFWLIPLTACSVAQKNPEPSKPQALQSDAVKSPGALELVFTYGSEKKQWIGVTTENFNRARHKTRSGREIYVNQIPMGSGECIDEVVSEARQTHLVSPASLAFIKLGNAKSRTKTGQDLIDKTENLVLSPVVIAMWKPMAEALGYGQKRIGWRDILELARDPEGWKSKGYPEWGSFKFGHTHPEYSNSGLISLFAEVYAAAGKVSDLTLNDVHAPQTAKFLEDIESSVVHYGSSTGFFGERMFAKGPGYISAAVLYENMIVESTDPKYQLPMPIVALYPEEGTFWSDHPIGIVKRPWVTSDHEDAAKKYLEFLLARPQQELALQYGFRPGDPAIPLTAPIELSRGVDPQEPRTTLEVPTVEVMDAILKLWRVHKKKSDVVLVMDVSGSMQKENRLENAKAGSLELLKLLGDEDFFSLVPFNNRVFPSGEALKVGAHRDTLERKIRGLFPEGGTALYDAVGRVFEHMQKNSARSRISAMVVLSDGEDTSSRLKLPELLNRIRSDHETKQIRVFTIGYGAEADEKILKQIADATNARFFKGNTENIREILREISTFF